MLLLGLSMRIIAGTYKGRALTPLTGDKTRPTTDRVREAWASSILSIFAELGRDLDDVSVLDAFAGSGALGLELLSRGVESCVFAEKDRTALAVVNKNIKHLGISKTQAAVLKTDSLSPKLLDALPPKRSFDLVVLDPPYKISAALMRDLLVNLAAGGKLKTPTVVSYEHAARTRDSSECISLDGLLLATPENNLLLTLVRRREYGTMWLDYFVAKQT